MQKLLNLIWSPLFIFVFISIIVCVLYMCIPLYVYNGMLLSHKQEWSIDLEIIIVSRVRSF